MLLLVFIYRPPRSSRQVCESDALAPSRVFSCASDRPLVIECQVCSLSTKPQQYTITVCCNHTAYIQHFVPVSVEARELNLEYVWATE